ncbi:MAG: PhoH family protein [Bacteroidia bacterium]|nr:PhoH family protein [Bacteroidia bacterium]
MVNKEIIVDHANPAEIFGVNNKHVKLFQQYFPKLKIVARGNQLFVNGTLKEIELFENKIELLAKQLKQFGNITPVAIDSILKKEFAQTSIDETDLIETNGSSDQDVIVYGNGGKIIRAKTPNQRKMVSLLKQNDILFAIGPAGTGKTYTAVALAVKALKNKEIKRIILTRPAVEAGESLGFLPGDLREKIDPYLRPLYDALDDMIQPEKLRQYIENRVIEIAPMAFMRGRTLDNAYVILDEAQNATDLQLKMFLTRMGPHAKFIVTGDLTQIDLPKKQASGLVRAAKILDGIEGIQFAYLNYEDVVRHKLVKDIIRAYDTE